MLYFARPALDSRQKILAVAFAALDLNWMNRTIFRQLTELPKGSRLTLLDETREMIRYDVDTGGWIVPQMLDPLLQQQMADRSSGTLVSADEELIKAIRKVHRGGKYISQSLAEKIAFALDEDTRKLPHETLSDREYQVLCQIGAGKTVSQPRLPTDWR